jgi:hypothetical protein
VPKRENFSLAIFTLIDAITVGDFGTGEKIFYQLTPDFDGFFSAR